MDALAREELFTVILYQQSQRILNMMKYVIDNMKASNSLMGEFAPVLEIVAFDQTTANGLSNVTTALLAYARQALLVQMLNDYNSNCLDRERLELLLGGGSGAAIVGKAIFELFFLNS